MDTAWELLAEKPLSQISIEDLASGAGISRSSFYFYFDSKEAVILALAGSLADDIRTTAMEFFSAHEVITYELVRRGVAAYMQRWKEKGHLLRAMFLITESDEELREFFAQFTEGMLLELADNAEQVGLVGPGPQPVDMIRVIFAMMWRMGYEVSVDQPEGEALDRVIDALTTVIFRSCFSPAILQESGS